MKRVLCSVLASAFLLLTVVGMSGCGNKSSKNVKNLMLEFEYACSSLDFDAVLDCIDPKVSDNIKMATGLVGMFTDQDTDDLFDSLAQYLSSDSGIKGKDFFSSINIDVDDVKISDDNATVYTTVTYSLAGEDYEREAVFECIYYTERWYISNFSFI